MKLIKKYDYNQTARINNKNVMCYDKNKLKELYPDGNGYSIVGETFEKNQKEAIDEVIIADKSFKVSKYGKNSKILYKRKWFFLVDNNKYIVFLKNRLPFLFLLFGIIIVGIAAIIIGYKILTHVATISPEYLLPPEDEKSENIENDNTIIDEASNKNYASIKVSREVTVNLKKKSISLIYQNFNASNKAAVVTLYILKNNDEYIIARSGLVKAGKEIKTMDYDKDAIKLTQGVYNGKIKVDFYDEITGEKGAASTDFTDVKVKVK